MLNSRRLIVIASVAVNAPNSALLGDRAELIRPQPAAIAAPAKRNQPLPPIRSPADLGWAPSRSSIRNLRDGANQRY